MKLLVPLVLALGGVGAGVGAGVALRPGPDDAGGSHDGATEHVGEAPAHGETASHDAAPAHEAASSHQAPASGSGHGSGHEGGSGDGSAEYVTLGNPFIVPVLEDSSVRSLVVLAVDLEVAPGQSGTVYRVEPKIRDALLTVLFDHANAGGFNGRFTSSGSMDILRAALREAGRKAVGEDVLTDVLITSIVRQDV